ncbi:MAG: hypothetical protein SP4CHLAM5_07320 [Chlamydiia bacterium]|nr:hypothetical protein [Chlamydiia bacterium]MCH9618599.1 hypothetical protein [Chlamydiia bacterium]MCH9624319.1 hypothetical protein [Chlamydiia bacterium]
MKADIPNIVYHPIATPGLAFWRLLWPAFHLGMRREITYSILRNFPIDSLPYLGSDVLVIQRFGNQRETEYMKKIASMRKAGNFRIIYDVDDAIFFDEVPQYHYSKATHDYSQEDYTKELMSLCDEMTVSTPYLKEYYMKKTGQENITVLPNRIPFFWAGHYYSPENVIRNYRKHKRRPRIIYAGSVSHIDTTGGKGSKNDDFASVIKAIEATRKEFKWIFVAACPPALNKYLESRDMDLYPWEVLGNLPKGISKLEGNMMIAPLADNPFNQGKSNIKLLEACAHGLPIACQDLTPYKEAPIRFTTGEDMIEKIRQTLQSEEKYIEESLKGRDIVNKYWLEQEQNIGAYRDVYTYPFGDPRRTYI